MKLSVVILCWNDMKVIVDCVRSIFASTHSTDFEVIVSDNGSTDGSPDLLEQNFPQVKVIRNGSNLGFARGNNAGIRASRGEYVLILNPDTIIHEGSLDRLVRYADAHPEAGAFGCRVLNADGTYQISARPFPTVSRYLMAALYLRPLGYLTDKLSEIYMGWKGDSERQIDWQSGCCVLFRGKVLRDLGGFDEQFFYQFEEVDLCFRVGKAGYPILFTPEATITHLGGQSVGRFRLKFELEKYRSRYRYFYKHFGSKGAVRCRRVALAGLLLRRVGYGTLNTLKHDKNIQQRLEGIDLLADWNMHLDPVRFVQLGEEPKVRLLPALQQS